MKYSIALLFTIMAWSSTCAFAQTFKPPSPQVIQEKLNLTMPELMKKCQKHTGLVQVVTEDWVVATKIAYVLADKVLKGAKTTQRIDGQSWDQLVKDYCLEDLVIKILREAKADDFNKCLDDENQLKGQKKTDFTNALLEAYCAEVKRLAKEKYAAGEN